MNPNADKMAEYEIFITFFLERKYALLLSIL